MDSSGIVLGVARKLIGVQKMTTHVVIKKYLAELLNENTWEDENVLSSIFST